MRVSIGLRSCRSSAQQQQATNNYLSCHCLVLQIPSTPSILPLTYDSDFINAGELDNAMSTPANLWCRKRQHDVTHVMRADAARILTSPAHPFQLQAIPVNCKQRPVFVTSMVQQRLGGFPPLRNTSRGTDGLHKMAVPPTSRHPPTCFSRN